MKKYFACVTQPLTQSLRDKQNPLKNYLLKTPSSHPLQTDIDEILGPLKPFSRFDIL